jgi:hypothetical protein
VSANACLCVGVCVYVCSVCSQIRKGISVLQRVVASTCKVRDVRVCVYIYVFVDRKQRVGEEVSETAQSSDDLSRHHMRAQVAGMRRREWVLNRMYKRLHVEIFLSFLFFSRGGRRRRPSQNALC